MAQHTIIENIHRNTEDWLATKAAVRGKGVDCPDDTPTADVAGKIEEIETGGGSNYGDGMVSVQTSTWYDDGTISGRAFTSEWAKRMGALIINENANFVIITNNAINNNSNIMLISIPSSVIKVGSYAFYNCPNIVNVIIGSGVTEIGEGAFDGCSRLQHVYYRGTEAQWNNIIIGTENNYLTSATKHYNYTGDGSELFPFVDN